jgi:ATP-dependent DNA helicase RecQ
LVEVMRAREALRRYFGYREFRAGQKELIGRLLAGGDCLGVMPTGAGKSLCYQLPALLLDGLTLVVSPLISLMQDQVKALRDAGVEAAFLNSTQDAAERSRVLREAGEGRCRLLYVAPERLDAPDFMQFASRARISLVAVDEAHCVSQWGQDFRPSYLRIKDFIDSLASRPPVGAFTATATARVRGDIIELLGLRQPLAVATGFDRPNLYFAVKHVRDKDGEVIAFLRENGRAASGQSGIIYCSTRAAVEELHGLLVKKGFAATRYHAGLTEQERRQNQDDFINDLRPVMVATNAFGMGIDKSNVSFVLHYNMPKNIESYYQEAGRAGRDGSPATCLLLYAPADVQMARFLISHAQDGTDLAPEARAELQEKDLELLKQMTFYATVNDCLRSFILGYFGESAPPFCDNCSNCHNVFEEVDATLDAQKIISCVFRLQQQGRSFGKSMVANILRGSKAQRIGQLGLDQLSTYGIMADVSLNRLHKVMDHLLAEGHLVLSGTEYPVLRLAGAWRELLAPDAQVSMKLPKEPDRGKKALACEKSKSSAAASLSNPEDLELFERLRALRFDLAKEANMPAYIIFSDATLRDMTLKRPATEAELLEVSGVGAAKLERYGKEFLACIADNGSVPGCG